MSFWCSSTARSSRSPRGRGWSWRCCFSRVWRPTDTDSSSSPADGDTPSRWLRSTGSNGRPRWCSDRRAECLRSSRGSSPSSPLTRAGFREAHPFTISSGAKEPRLRFTMKVGRRLHPPSARRSGRGCRGRCRGALWSIPSSERSGEAGVGGRGDRHHAVPVSAADDGAGPTAEPSDSTTACAGPRRRCSSTNWRRVRPNWAV